MKSNKIWFGLSSMMAVLLSGCSPDLYMTVTPPFQCNDVAESDHFHGGDGSVSDPYQVCSAKQLDLIRTKLDKNYVQIADIDLSASANNKSANWFLPISDPTIDKSDLFAGNQMSDPSKYFTGIYDGGNYEIKNWSYVPSTQDDRLLVGFFPVNGGTIKKLKLTGFSVSAAAFSGALVGSNAGLIEDVLVSGTMTGLTYSGSQTINLGSLVTVPPMILAMGVGMEAGKITNMEVTGTLNAPVADFVGGAAAFVVDAMAAIDDSGMFVHHFTITGHASVGGIVGITQVGGSGILIRDSVVSNSTVTAVGPTQTLGQTHAGGAIASLEGNASNISVSHVTVTGVELAGGVMAKLQTETSTVTQLTALDVTVTANARAAGLVAELDGALTHSSVTSSTITGNATYTDSGSGSNAGGAVANAKESASIDYVYASDVTVTSNSVAGGLIGETSATSPDATVVQHSYAIRPIVTTTNVATVNSLQVGGLIGVTYSDNAATPDLSATITDCFVIGGSVSGYATADTSFGGVGGLVGNQGGEGAGGLINRSYVYGTSVLGESVAVGGFVGYSQATVTNSYGAASSIGAGPGIAPWASASFYGGTGGALVSTQNYYLSGVGADHAPALAVGLTDAQMKATSSSLMVGVADDATHFKFGSASLNPYPQLIYQ